jgi:hypothetical protein
LFQFGNNIYRRQVMLLDCGEIIVRDFERKDAENIFRIVREKTFYDLCPIGLKIKNRRKNIMNQ